MFVRRVPRRGRFGVRQARRPWARPRSGCTALFGALVTTLVSEMAVPAVATADGRFRTTAPSGLSRVVGRTRARLGQRACEARRTRVVAALAPVFHVEHGSWRRLRWAGSGSEPARAASPPAQPPLRAPKCLRRPRDGLRTPATSAPRESLASCSSPDVVGKDVELGRNGGWRPGTAGQRRPHGSASGPASRTRSLCRDAC